jgi:hypothetical protein
MDALQAIPIVQERDTLKIIQEYRSTEIQECRSTDNSYAVSVILNEVYGVKDLITPAEHYNVYVHRSFALLRMTILHGALIVGTIV